MDSWNYRPARDFELTPVERARSLNRKPGIWSAWPVWHGTAWPELHEDLPPAACRGNRASPGRASVHPDCQPFEPPRRHRPGLGPSSASVQPCVSRCRGRCLLRDPSPVAPLCPSPRNTLPMWRKNCGPHALAELKERLVEEPCGYILFPEGARSRDGSLKPFKAGLGMIVAGTPVPVIPCWISGALSGLAPRIADRPRPRKVGLRIGPPLLFDGVSNAHRRLAAGCPRGRGGGAPAGWGIGRLVGLRTRTVRMRKRQGIRLTLPCT